MIVNEKQIIRVLEKKWMGLKLTDYELRQEIEHYNEGTDWGRWKEGIKNYEKFETEIKDRMEKIRSNTEETLKFLLNKIAELEQDREDFDRRLSKLEPPVMIDMREVNKNDIQ